MGGWTRFRSSSINLHDTIRSACCAMPVLVLVLLGVLSRIDGGAHPVEGFSPMSTIAAAYTSGTSETGVACAIVADGSQRVQCWGLDSGPAMLPDNLGPFFGLVGGASFFCGLVKKPSTNSTLVAGSGAGGARAVCWSAYNLSQVFLLPEEYQNFNFSTLAAGNSHACGIKQDTGTVVCWIPISNSSTNGLPGQYRAIAAGNNFTCGIPINESTVLCYGDVPSAINAGLAEFQLNRGKDPASAISAGDAHVCVLVSSGFSANNISSTTDGSAVNQPLCWGDVHFASRPPPSSGFSSLFSGHHFVCGILYNDSKLECSPSSVMDATELNNLTASDFGRLGLWDAGFTAAAAGDTFVCGISSASLTAFCFGLGQPGKPLQLFNPAVCQSDSTLVDAGYSYKPELAHPDLPPARRFCEDAADHTWLPCPVCPSNSYLNITCGTNGTGGPWVCQMNMNPKAASNLKKHSHLVEYITAAVVVALLLCCFLTKLPQFKFKLFPGFQSVQHFHDQEHVKVTEFGYRQLEVATGGFDEANLVGRGRYGLVFKGTVQCPSKKLVAIKQLEHKPSNSLREQYLDFDSELTILARLQHSNLVNLIGYCHERGAESKFRLTPQGVVCAIKCAYRSYKYSKQISSTMPDSIGIQQERAIKDRRLLVFDYMANGTLYDQIHGNRGHLSSSSVQCLSPLISSWSARLRVAGQVAKGLQYLHGLDPPVIHRDVKTSNILLDSEWNAKLSDLGLSRLGPQGQHSHVVTDPKGTLGYCDPEYLRTSHLTMKSDVYGFGVVLLELLTGLKAIEREHQEANLVSRCRSVIQDGQVASMLDSRIEEGNPRQTESVAKLANIAEICVRDSPKERPSMRQVAIWIEKLTQCLAGKRLALDFDIESEDFSCSQVSDAGSDIGPHFAQSFTVDVKDIAGGIAIKPIPGSFRYLHDPKLRYPTIPEVPEESGTSRTGASASGTKPGVSATDAQSDSSRSGKFCPLLIRDDVQRAPNSGPLTVKRPTLTMSGSAGTPTIVSTFPPM